MLQRERRAKTALTGDNVSSEVPVFFFDFHQFQIFQHSKTVEKRKQLCGNRGNCSTYNSPLKYENKQKVQDNICDSGD